MMRMYGFQGNSAAIVSLRTAANVNAMACDVLQQNVQGFWRRPLGPNLIKNVFEVQGLRLRADAVFLCYGCKW